MELLKKLPAPCNKKKSRLSYSITFKLAAVRHAEAHGNRATARYLGINEKQIRDWRSKKDNLMISNSNAKRLKCTGRQIIESKDERDVKAWFDSDLQVGDQRFLMNDSHRIKTKKHDEQIEASSCWLRRWKMRHSALLKMSEDISINSNDYFINNNDISIGNKNLSHHKKIVDNPNTLSPFNDYSNAEKEFVCALALLELRSPIFIHHSTFSRESSF